MTSLEQQGPTEVELPDGTIVEFPPGMNQDAMKQALQKKFPPPVKTGGADCIRGVDKHKGLLG